MQTHFPLNPATGVEDLTQLPWQNGVPSTGQEGSYPPFQLVVNPQTELVGLIGWAGLTPSDTDMNQVTRSVRGGQLDFDATDTGTADAMQCQIGLPHTAVKPGMPFTFIKGPNANTGAFAPSLTITDLQGNNGVTGAIVKATGAPLAKGDLPGNALVTVRAISAGVFALVSLLTISDVIALIAAQQIGVPQPPIIYATPGTFIYTPSTTTRAWQFTVIGGCGGGGGTNAPGSGGVSMGISGAAGATALKGLLSLGSATATIVVGAGGAGGAASAAGGGNGGTSSVTCGNATITCTGGAGGQNTGTVASFPQGTSTATGGSATGGDINVVGGCSQAGLFLSSAQALVGPAGARLYGASPIQFGITQGGSSGVGRGSGGTGGLAYGGAAAQTGGAGDNGLVIVTEYH